MVAGCDWFTRRGKCSKKLHLDDLCLQEISAQENGWKSLGARAEVNHTAGSSKCCVTHEDVGDIIEHWETVQTGLWTPRRGFTTTPIFGAEWTMDVRISCTEAQTKPFGAGVSLRLTTLQHGPNATLVSRTDIEEVDEGAYIDRYFQCKCMNCQ